MVEDLSFGITKQDHQNACECKFDVLQTKSLPWKLESDGTTSQWPPSNDFLTSFGYGNAGDEQWWEENTGLEPPSLWNVSGALDLLPTLSMSYSKGKCDGCVIFHEDDYLQDKSNFFVSFITPPPTSPSNVHVLYLMKLSTE